MMSRFHCRMRISPEENMRRIAPTIAGTVSSGKKAQAAVPVMSVSFFARSVKKIEERFDENGKLILDCRIACNHDLRISCSSL